MWVPHLLTTTSHYAKPQSLFFGKVTHFLLFTVTHCERCWVGRLHASRIWQSMNAPRLKFQTSTPSFIKNYSNSNHLIPALGLRLPTGFLHLDWLWYNMGLRMFMLVVLGLLVFTDHSQGIVFLYIRVRQDNEF